MNLLISQPEFCGASRREMSKAFFILNPVLLEINTAIQPLITEGYEQEERTDYQFT